MSSTRPPVHQLTLDDVRNMPDAALSRAQLAALLKVDPRTVTRGIEDGTIPAIKLGTRTLIPRERLLALLDGTATPAV